MYISFQLKLSGAVSVSNSISYLYYFSRFLASESEPKNYQCFYDSSSFSYIDVSMSFLIGDLDKLKIFDYTNKFFHFVANLFYPMSVMALESILAKGLTLVVFIYLFYYSFYSLLICYFFFLKKKLAISATLPVC